MNNQTNTQLMGILNITPDSFSDGGDYYQNIEKAVVRAKQMIAEGANIIDIGGESTRPGAELIAVDEEKHRVIPVITAIKKALPQVILSIDTWKHQVAQEALHAGCTIVNSLGGFTYDQKLAAVVADSGCKLIMYHINGKPKTMQQRAIDSPDIIQGIGTFFEEQISLGEHYGIKKEQYILDPGIGFGKTVEQNITILKNIQAFQPFGLPIAIGVSRKSHLGMILKDSLGLETTPQERLEASLAETAVAVQNGATIIRTHDVLATKKFITVFERFR